MRKRRTAWLAAALVACCVTACTGGSGNGPDSAANNSGAPDRITSQTVPDKNALNDAAAHLPADPVDAAQQLVDTAFSADFTKAVAAVGDVLLRSGIPLVSANGPVVALPADRVIVNVPVDVELLPSLTLALRSNVVFTPDQVASLLQLEGDLSQPVTGAQVVGILAEWGKGDGAPSEVITAGAAARASAAERHALLTPDNVMDAATLRAIDQNPDKVDAETLSRTLASGGTVDLDPLQVVLLAAHAGSDVETGVRVGHGAPPSPSPSVGHSFLHIATADPCDYLDTSKAPGGKEVGDTAKAVAKKIFRSWIKDAAKARYGSKVANNIGAGFKGLDKTLDIVTIALLELGAKLDVTSDKPSTHFRHEATDDSRNVFFKATASFSSALAQKRLPCWAMAGISLPPDGPLSGYTVRWALRAEPQVLRVENEDDDMITDGAKTDSDGQTPTIETYPRRESSPPKNDNDQPQHTVIDTMTATLDKDDFAIHLKDLFGMGTASKLEGAPLYLAYQMAVSLAKRGVLPITKLAIPVTYHGQNPYAVHGNGYFYAAFLAKVGFTADLYSCTSAAGPWRGTASLTGTSDGTLEILSGRGTPGGGSGTEKHIANFTLNADSPSEQRVSLGGKFGLVIKLDPDEIKKIESSQQISDQYDRLADREVVGTGSWSVANVDIRDAAGMLGRMFSSGTTFDVVAVQRDPRCPGSSIWDDPFDPS